MGERCDLVPGGPTARSALRANVVYNEAWIPPAVVDGLVKDHRVVLEALVAGADCTLDALANRLPRWPLRKALGRDELAQLMERIDELTPEEVSELLERLEEPSDEAES